MDNIKETIKENLIRLRKDKKMTQLELAEKINYSDKAISRWEKGEVTPDIETLEKLSKVYDVPFECFFAKNEKRFHSFKLRKIEMGNKLAISLLAILCVWFISTFLFVYLNTFMGTNHWIIFIWAVPVSCAVGIVFNSIWGKIRNTFIIVSILIWTLITAICLQIYMNFNIFPWLIYIVGIPMQIGTILFAFISPSKRRNSIEQGSHHE
ncbi:MAG: helix-turn-helix transcriptional regulator [Erysipelotrichaceae bacterium]|nr:helix-turn-helix transcriptional regulator [Erysipelotrichaceae bacterium]